MSNMTKERKPVIDTNEELQRELEESAAALLFEIMTIGITIGESEKAYADLLRRPENDTSPLTDLEKKLREVIHHKGEFKDVLDALRIRLLRKSLQLAFNLIKQDKREEAIRLMEAIQKEQFDKHPDLLTKV